jgi:hypothetical protein
MSEKHLQRAMPFSIGTGGMRYLIIGIMALSALTGSALAHTPAGVEVSYDGMSGELGVAITHQVEDPVTHYVKQVTVRQGSTVLIAQTYTSQPNKKAFTYRYYLPQLKGRVGEIRADVECNIVGARSGTLYMVGTTVAGTPGAATPSPTKAPGCIFIALLAVGFAAMRVMR